MFLVEEGELIHVVNRKKEHLPPGTLVFIRPADEHRFTASPHECSFTNVIIPKETLRFFRERYLFLQDVFFWSSSKQPFQIQLEGETFSRIQSGMKELFFAPRSMFEIERFLMAAFGELSRIMGKTDHSDVSDWLRSALGSIREPERAALGIQEFYRLAGRSPEHVSRTLKKQLGVTPSEVVNRARLEMAAGLLEMTDQNISAIAMDCGFKSLGWFYSVFHRQFGITPLHYRRRKQFLPKPG